MMRLTCCARNAVTAIATARYVLPVPAGPTPIVTVFFRMLSQYAFWPTVFGFTGLPFAVMHTQSSASGAICASRSSCTMSMQ